MNSPLLDEDSDPKDVPPHGNEDTQLEESIFFIEGEFCTLLRSR